MKYVKTFALIAGIILSNICFPQDKNAPNDSKKESTNKAPKANAGDDIKAFPGGTIPISGEGSLDPDGDRIKYIWSFPPSLIFEDSYKYHRSDRIKIHKNPDDNSIETIETYTRAFLLDVPEFSPVGSNYEINLVVKDPEGLSSKDSFILEVIMPDSSQISDKENDDIIIIEDKNRKEEQQYYKISIQAVSSNTIVPMQESAINYMIYNILKDFGMNNIIDPTDYMPDTLYEIKEMDNTKDAIQSRYNYTCFTDSCASQNAIMQKATHVLAWTFNDHSSLSMKFFDPKEYLIKNKEFSWRAFSLPIDPERNELMKLPSSIAIDKNGDLIIASSNNHSIYKAGLDQTFEEYIAGIVYNRELINPSGIDVGTDGKVYVSDKDNNRIFAKEKNKYKNIMDSNSGLKSPSALRALKNGSIVAVCDDGQSVKRVSSNGRISTLLEPGIVSGMTDIAVYQNSDIYIVSPYENRVLKILSSSKVELVAGADKNKGLKGNNIPAKEAKLFKPVSIDFDNKGNLYIAEKEKGYLRIINSDGVLNRVAGGGSEINLDGLTSTNDVDLKNVTKIRIGNGPKIYLSLMVDNSIICITPTENYNYIGSDLLMTPMHIINKNGISGLESHFKSVLPKILKGYMPKQKIPISKRLKSINKNISDYFSERPLLFAVLLFGGLQVSSELSNNGELGTPPDWPF
ncbi:hypothetical protein EVA24_05725 [bacterium]|nr:MAG: hypothetical protein EVA24_05725 [bacterium]